MTSGTDNTSTTLGLALYFLTSEPRFYQRLRAELDATFSDPLGSCSLNTLANLPFLNAVIQECLRLGTPFFLPREPGPGGAHVDGRFIPEGTVAAFAAWSQQTSPDNFYPEPMVRYRCSHACRYGSSITQSFRPERWLPEGLGPDTKTNKAVLASFSYGASRVVDSLLHPFPPFVVFRALFVYRKTSRVSRDPPHAGAHRSGVRLRVRTWVRHPRLLRRPQKHAHDTFREEYEDDAGTE